MNHANIKTPNGRKKNSIHWRMSSIHDMGVTPWLHSYAVSEEVESDCLLLVVDMWVAVCAEPDCLLIWWLLVISWQHKASPTWLISDKSE
jgi:hypothetical protein